MTTTFLQPDSQRLDFQQLERRVFDNINKLVVPLLIRGVGSSSMTPASLVLLESVGYKSGKTRQTPVWSLKIGACRLVGTARGNRSFWVKNLNQHDNANYYLAGEKVSASAIVLAPDFDNLHQWDVNELFSKLSALLNRFVARGWAFAILVPEKS